MINGVNTGSMAAQQYEPARKQDNVKNTEKSQVKGNEDAAVLEIGKSYEAPAVTYSKPVPAADQGNDNTKELNAQEINKLWEEANKATENLRRLVEDLLRSQGKTFQGVLKGKEELIVDEKTRAAAQQAISEEGECGVKAVSDRIVSFAKAVSNDNPEMYDKLMGAIKEGFAQAEKTFGGKLPEICYKTRDEIDRKMEEWKNSKNTTTEEID